MLDETLSPASRSRMVAEIARDAISEAQATNRAALGRDPEQKTFVDGRVGAALDSVNPDRGVILAVFDVSTDLFDYVGRMLVQHSPRLTGRYQDSHVLFADGVEVERYDAARRAEEWVFLNVQPYARKIEAGSSDQAPDGVYEAVAALASRRFGNVASVKFSWRSPVATATRAQERATRVPAISIRLY
ncbi:hypothetical protein [Bosea sp. Root670]|uniref:hypothetical protein n=1 Tax=Bosea sp. Root670 TaxID=1736583 RepID=UPI000B2BF50B|nr:hypothetical protein [Bosea sp. Root670]